jgi:hypothetical protein
MAPLCILISISILVAARGKFIPHHYHDDFALILPMPWYSVLDIFPGTVELEVFQFIGWKLREIRAFGTNELLRSACKTTVKRDEAGGRTDKSTGSESRGGEGQETRARKDEEGVKRFERREAMRRE